MARKVRVVVVCEDILHETFMRAFLYRRGFHRRQLTFRKPHAGQGDAKQGVCQLLVRELQAVRQRPGQGLGLIYMIDADALSIGERRRLVEDYCRSHGADPPADNEPVFAVVPKWEMENLLAYLRDESVDEGTNAYRKYKKCESEIYPLVDRLADMCDNQNLPDPPPSLAAVCADYPRFGKWLRQN